MNKETIKVGTINPNRIKSRDLVHRQEITHGTGCGAHKGFKDYQEKQLRQQRARLKKGLYGSERRSWW